VTIDVEYVLTHAEDAANRIRQLEADLKLANARILELQSVQASPDKRWWQK
jgi:hypothetical protein